MMNVYLIFVLIQEKTKTHSHFKNSVMKFVLKIFEVFIRNLHNVFRVQSEKRVQSENFNPFCTVQ